MKRNKIQYFSTVRRILCEIDENDLPVNGKLVFLLPEIDDNLDSYNSYDMLE